MAEVSRLGTAFPQYGCDVKLETGALVVVSSRDESAPETASGVLRDCWRAYGMKPVVEEVDRFQGTGRPYTVAMIGAEARFLAPPLPAPGLRFHRQGLPTDSGELHCAGRIPARALDPFAAPDR